MLGGQVNGSVWGVPKAKQGTHKKKAPGLLLLFFFFFFIYLYYYDSQGQANPGMEDRGPKGSFYH